MLPVTLVLDWLSADIQDRYSDNMSSKKQGQRKNEIQGRNRNGTTGAVS